jgi:transcriptional regulator with XRE-family HTH domain
VSDERLWGSQDQIERNQVDRLRRRREELGWSQAEAARQLAKAGHRSGGGTTVTPTVSRQMIYKIENGQRGLGSAELELFLAVYGFDEDEERDFRNGLGRPYKPVEITGTTATAQLELTDDEKRELWDRFDRG